MILSEVSIRRPVLAWVGSILIVLVGLLSYLSLPVREYPDTDTPTIAVTTIYPGASAEVVESKVTEPLEEQISATDGIRVLKSTSREQVSQITIEFDLKRDVDEAANDVRDKVGRARARLPDEVREPQVSKVESDANPFIWIAFYSDRYSRLELTDYVDRFAKQRIQTVPGVGNIIIGGERRYAMRVWLESDKLAAFGLTAADVERALRQQNVDIPGGRIESYAREFTVRTKGDLTEASAFDNLVLATRGSTQIKLSDVGRAELGSEDYRTRTFFNGKPTAGLGVVRQSRSNLLEVAAAVKELLPVIQNEIPEGIGIEIAYDASLFVERSVEEVYYTLGLAVFLVILVIFAFLRDWRATLIPLVAIPVAIIGSFAFMLALNFSINILTLLALVLAVGLVVDDAIVMLENIYRRVEEGENPVHASLFGSRQVAFAIIATTLTLAAVFLPVAFQSGTTGRLFYEFGLTLSVAVIVSGFVALTLTPMLCSRLLRARGPGQAGGHGWFYRVTEPLFVALNRAYAAFLAFSMRHKLLVALGALAFFALGPLAYLQLQRELVPVEDRGLFLSFFKAPLGSTPDYTGRYVADMDRIVREIPEVKRNFSVTALGRGTPGVGNEGLMFTSLALWEDRQRPTQAVLGEIAAKYATQVTGGLAFPIPIKPLGQRGIGEGIQFVLRGTDTDKLQQLGDQLAGVMRESGQFAQTRVEPSPNKPQLDVSIDRAKAADLQVPVAEIAASLETLMGGRQVTEFRRGNRQYDVIVQVDDADRMTPADLSRVYVRSGNGQLIQLANLVAVAETVTPENYQHFDRLRSVQVVSQMAPGYTLGDGVAWMEKTAKEMLPEGYSFEWDGEGREYVESSGDTFVLFGLALVFTFLILAAQFESWVHPVTIYTGVALAVAAGVAGLYAARYWGDPLTDNIFSRFGVIMLIGLVAKNGILIVEFANQLQVEGRSAAQAAFEAATLRFRPILMTAISTIFGAVPIAFATGAGAETRHPLGVVVVVGLAVSTILTLFVIPVAYVAMDRLVVRFTGHSSTRGLQRAAQIEAEIAGLERVRDLAAK